MTRTNAVVLLSGGLDSATTMAMATAEGYAVHALSFNYSQRHAVELDAARKLATALKVKQHLVLNFDAAAIGGSALTSDIAVPKIKLPKNEAPPAAPPAPSAPPQAGIPITYVPARNTIFLSFALAWAEVLAAPDIFIGANIMDYSGYPDCRPEYLSAFEAMANLATKAGVQGEMSFKVKAPLIRMSKAEIILKGLSLGLDYSLTWSCYDPTPKGKPCRACDSCLIRAKGFKEAGVDDPL